MESAYDFQNYQSVSQFDTDGWSEDFTIPDLSSPENLALLQDLTYPKEDYQFVAKDESSSDNCSYSPDNNGQEVLTTNQSLVYPQGSYVGPTEYASQIYAFQINEPTNVSTPEEVIYTPVLQALPQTSNYQEVVHKCLHCPKSFKKICYLKQHFNAHHTGDKPLKCIQCGKRFNIEEKYQMHLMKHKGNQPFKCQTCPKRFHHKQDLIRHEKQHRNEFTHVCEVCQKGFMRRDHFHKHVMTHVRKQLMTTRG